MIDPLPLNRIGLSDSEVKIYLSLLSLGKANATQLAEDSGVHRTNVYSILDKLKERGLASQFHENHKLVFKITDPKNLLNYLKETETMIQGILPDLDALKESVKEKVEVEVFRGEKGMKAAFKDQIREGKDVVGFGIAGQLRHNLPVFSSQYVRDMKHRGILSRHLYAEGTEFHDAHWEVRVLPRDFMTPVATQIYSNKVCISIWEPAMVAIIVTSAEVAENYRKHFELMWSLAKPPSRKPATRQP